MIVRNPTKDKISVQIGGHQYTIEPKGTLSVPDARAKYWKEKLHDFLILEKENNEVTVEDVVKEVEKAKEELDATDTAVELAEEHGVDLTKVEGTGADGRILKSDVEAVIQE